MTHKKWVSEITRLFRVAERSPDEAIERLNHLVGSIEAERQIDTGEWHVAQTLGIIGAILADNGRHRAAGAAFLRLAKHHQLESVYHERA